jgi:hypothetical protein
MADVDIVVRVGDVDSALLDGINDSAELRRVYNDFLDDAEALWKLLWEQSGTMTKSGHHEYETGDYVEHIKTNRIPYRKWAKKFLAEGIPFGSVYNDSHIAEKIEYGTKVDKPGSRSPWGPNTPTPEFAIMRKVAAIMNNEVKVT